MPFRMGDLKQSICDSKQYIYDGKHSIGKLYDSKQHILSNNRCPLGTQDKDKDNLIDPREQILQTMELAPNGQIWLSLQKENNQ